MVPRGQMLGAGNPNARFGNNQPGNRAFGNQPGHRGFGNQPGSRAFGNNQFRPRGFTNRDPRLRAVNAATPQMRQVQRVSHRAEMVAVRARMPVYPLPGERNFTGVPPAGETRFAAAEMVCQFGPEMTPQAIGEIARRHDLTIIATHQSALTGGTLVQFRIGGNRATAAYQLTTGTSVAAAHVSAVAALLLERHPQADAATILEVLTASATRLGASKRDDKIGWGLVDPLAALAELDARLTDVKIAAPATAPAPAPIQAAAPARPATAATPAAATTRPALPRPGIFLPKQ